MNLLQSRGCTRREQWNQWNAPDELDSCPICVTQVPDGFIQANPAAGWDSWLSVGKVRGCAGRAVSMCDLAAVCCLERRCCCASNALPVCRALFLRLGWGR